MRLVRASVRLCTCVSLVYVEEVGNRASWSQQSLQSPSGGRHGSSLEIEKKDNQESTNSARIVNRITRVYRHNEPLIYPYPSNLIMDALFLRIPCRAIRVQFSRGQVLKQDLEIWVALEYTRINRRQHILCSHSFGPVGDSRQVLGVERYWTDA
jgi:hypothetical protein